MPLWTVKPPCPSCLYRWGGGLCEAGMCKAGLCEVVGAVIVIVCVCVCVCVCV